MSCRHWDCAIVSSLAATARTTHTDIGPRTAERQSWLESVRDLEPDNNFVELYAVAGLRGVYIASTVEEGMYSIEVY